MHASFTSVLTRRRAFATALGMLLTCQTACAQQPSGTRETWISNASLERIQTILDRDVGAGQGVSRFGDRLYVYGDLVSARPRHGVIKEFDLDLQPTGRQLRLTRKGEPLATHPTGLTRHPQWGTFLGDTVQQRARIYRLDWERAWADGNLDHAVLEEIEDDVAINGCRPHFVELDGQVLLATADYGELRPEIRLYDPAKLLAARRSSAPGVVVHRILSGPFNQNLHWDPDRGELVCVQNVVAGRGWRIEHIDLRQAIADGRVWGPNVRIASWTLPEPSELEGFVPLPNNRSLFVVASRRETLVIGRIQGSDSAKGSAFEPRP
jgi:hypothetical protein